MRIRKGFTLVEIMIVVAIIALLAAIAIPNLLRARVNANDSAAQASLKSYATAIESYAGAEGLYPLLMVSMTEASPPYIVRNLHGVTKGGYEYGMITVINLTTGGYTLTAGATSANTGNWDYQVTTGARLQRSVINAGSYADF